MTNRLEPGSSAPAFSLPDAAGRQVSLADYRGRKVVVYFYPAAMTPGCTTQAVDFTSSLADFAQAGYDVVGISPDSVDALAAFREKEALGVTLLADPDKQVLKAYGAWGTKMLYGKEITGVLRSTFVVDIDDQGHGTITTAQYNVKATGHVDKLKRDLGI